MSTEIQENISPDKTNEITETESTSAKATNNKIKDPRKVAAGKKLAEKNKIAREALKKQREEKEKDSSSWLPNTSFTTILSVVGIGLTIFDLYLRTRQKQSPSTENEIPEVVNKTQTQSQTKKKKFWNGVSEVHMLFRITYETFLKKLCKIFLSIKKWKTKKLKKI